jgi:hypothetical protein
LAEIPSALAICQAATAEPQRDRFVSEIIYLDRSEKESRRQDLPPAFPPDDENGFSNSSIHHRLI